VSMEIRARGPADAEWSSRLLTAAWGSTRSVTRGRMVDAAALPGLVAALDGEPSGLLTYRIEGRALEIVTLNSLRERRGAGTALVAAALAIAVREGCRRVWLITTNDNTPALRFYQKRGFTLAGLYPNALEVSRRLKPEIPLVGRDGIPLRDEIELEIRPDAPA
jgi:ribosomal protein S18 acetylase RimI-like enzyme